MAGFTLVELMIVMGILSFFLLFLVGILRDSLSLWQQGEQRISLEGRGAAALDLLSRDIEQVQGVHGKSYKPGRKARFRALRGSKLGPSRSGRLVADWQAWVDHRTPAHAKAAFEIPAKLDWHQRLRMVCRLDVQENDRILRRHLRAKILREEGQLGPAELENLILERIQAMAVRPLAEVCLRVLPVKGGDGSYLTLQRDVQLLTRDVRERWVDGGQLPAPGEPLLSNLLYVEFLFRSQFTQSFSLSRSSNDGPESCWDSARAGLFPDEHPVLRFSLDFDQKSLMDPLDDVMPGAVRVLVVVDEGPELASTAFLARDIEERSRQIEVEFPDRLPLPEPGQPAHVKIRTEWISYQSLDGNRLSGVRRGVRHTAPRPHKSGTRIHSGRTMTRTLKLSQPREYWND